MIEVNFILYAIIDICSQALQLPPENPISISSIPKTRLCYSALHSIELMNIMLLHDFHAVAFAYDADVKERGR